MADFDESKHPRDKRGEFTTGDGGSSGERKVFGPVAALEAQQDAWQKRWSASGIKGSAPTIDLENPKYREGAERTALAAGRVASRLSFDPKNITITDKAYEFNLNGHQHYAAGTHLDGQVTLYIGQLAPGQIGEVTSHEVEHAKYQAFLDDHRAQYEAMMKEPGPAPDPNGRYYWQKKGGQDAVTTAEDRARPPYDAKYPLINAWKDLTDGDPSRPDQSNLEKMAKEDGCSPYSRDWWDAQKNGTADYRQAFHETLAEMAAARSKIIPTTANGEQTHDEHLRFGSPPTAIYHNDLPDGSGGETTGYLLRNEPSPTWNKLYDLVEKNWQEKHAMK